MPSTNILLTINIGQQLFVDPKRIRLLKEIAQCGSISQAAKNAGVSYKSAWDHLSAMNDLSPKPLLERNTGGKNGGGTVLTVYAKRLLQLYSLLETTQHKAFDILQDEHIPLDNPLTATAKFAPQSSARNQLFGQVKHWTTQGVTSNVVIEIPNFPYPMTATITQTSHERLQLCKGKEVMLMIKAPWVKLHRTQTNLENCFPATVQKITPNHCNQEIVVQSGDLLCYAITELGTQFSLGEQIWVSINPEQIILLTL